MHLSLVMLFRNHVAGQVSVQTAILFPWIHDSQSLKWFSTWAACFGS